MIILKAV